MNNTYIPAIYICVLLSIVEIGLCGYWFSHVSCIITLQLAPFNLYSNRGGFYRASNVSNILSFLLDQITPST